MAERGSFRSWAFSVSVKLSLVMGANRVRVGDSIAIQTQALSGGLVVPCLLIGLQPDPYTGTARLDLRAAVDPYVYQSVYDYVWDGGLVSDPDYDANARKFSAILDYPFKSGSGAGTFPSGGDVNLIYDQNDYQFQNNTFADSQSEYIPFE